MSRFEEKTLGEISEELQLSARTVENHLLTERHAQLYSNMYLKEYIRIIYKINVYEKP